ncbi:MAG: hypothetical protein KAX25_03645, partial [Dehalococcoidia bacterium]|nr:hypothetical protein [Dehalococcoidia bacterium]
PGLAGVTPEEDRVEKEVPERSPITYTRPWAGVLAGLPHGGSCLGAGLEPAGPMRGPWRASSSRRR